MIELVKMSDYSRKFFERELPEVSLNVDDVNKLLEQLYDLIMYKGFDENWDYNSFGEDAQNVYDDLYNNTHRGFCLPIFRR